MADISKCPAVGCPMRESCLRYTVPDWQLQSYFVQTPHDRPGKCDYFWDNGRPTFIKYDAYCDEIYLSRSDFNWDEIGIIDLGSL